ncbi:hypothetical protein [Mycobacterium malmoense]|uniref:hypothetical protein n=1 Tax=Mycobacterium malmoense TaxID=1780 RepID=UPI00111C9105|nr:hypothetical protein [Mycobacterium malmoense]UNB94931.1 hypothetical protein H5T25_02775 [Mycobacterium malmoense]
MDLAARPHITAGVALAGAAVLAAGPTAQHLPDLHLAQHLPQVSVSNINLTDAATSVMDLFSGVESQLASLASGASAAAVPASLLGNVVSPITQNLIVQTWETTFQNAGTNLQYIFNTWSKVPFPVLQQLVGNGIQYASDYVGAFQTSARNAVGYFTSPQFGNFGPLLQTALTDLTSGNIATGIPNLFAAVVTTPFIDITEPLEGTLEIPAYITQNLANATDYLGLTAVPDFAQYTLNLTNLGSKGLGTGLQAVSNSWGAGDPIGALTNLLNTPGVITNDVLNGVSASPALGPNGGLLSSLAFKGKVGSVNGLLNIMLNTVSPGLAQEIEAPGAQPIMSSGSLATALQNFVNQLINGWPSLTPVINSISGQLTAVLQSIPSVLSNLPSILSNLGGQLASDIGLLISNILRLL